MNTELTEQSLHELQTANDNWTFFKRKDPQRHRVSFEILHNLISTDFCRRYYMDNFINKDNYMHITFEFLTAFKKLRDFDCIFLCVYILLLLRHLLGGVGDCFFCMRVHRHSPVQWSHSYFKKIFTHFPITDCNKTGTNFST